MPVSVSQEPWLCWAQCVIARDMLMEGGSSMTDAEVWALSDERVVSMVSEHFTGGVREFAALFPTVDVADEAREIRRREGRAPGGGR